MIEFNPDGSLKLPEGVSPPKRKPPHIMMLQALDEIPFGVGKKLLIDFLRGEVSTSIKNNKLDMLLSFGTLAYTAEELQDILQSLVRKGMIAYIPLPKVAHIKVLSLTSKGRDELESPSFEEDEMDQNEVSFNYMKTTITDEDKKKFLALDSFLNSYNDEQKKAIISDNASVLCVAGAGSGKTTVLTKRIEFLVKYKSIPPKDILAITFTRKARKEMEVRLDSYGIHDVKVETFNSFCEKLLKRYGDKIYETEMSVVMYKDKIIMVRKALQLLGINMNKAVDTYFTFSQKQGKTNEQLAAIFMNDCFFVRDYMHLNDKKISEELFEDIEPSHKDSADIVYGVCNFIDSYMKKNGLRDFADQLIDGIRLIRKHPDVKPLFSHILIDEFQDVNSLQMNLVSLLNSQNVFCVGDPRQSIYGWRGSDISFIKDFPKDHDNCEVISLVKNYRSSKAVVELFNESIRYMNLPDLETVNEGKKDIRLLNFKNEEAEAEFVVQAILNSDVPHDNIFILARTNKQLVKISGYLHNNKVPHEMRSDEFGKITKDEGALEESKKVVLATIHAIKGLEAELVFVVGCTRNKFPCKGSEHPVIEMIKIDEYDKYNEERRLFYVALSRAKSSLYLTYVGKSHTDFITSAMTKIVYGRTISNGQGTLDTDTSMFDRLKRWRLKTAKEYGMPAFMVLTDKTLTGLIAQQPFSIEDLSKVPGFGPTKINQFGEDILKVLHS